MKVDDLPLGSFRMIVSAIFLHKKKYSNRLPKRIVMHPACYKGLIADKEFADFVRYGCVFQYGTPMEMFGVPIEINSLVQGVKMVTYENVAEPI